MALHALTFELRILLRKGRRTVKDHKSGLKRRLTLVLPAQEVEGGSKLAPVLGQVQINTTEFASLFNEKSAIYDAGFPVFSELLVFWDKPFELNFLPFPFVFFIRLFESLSFTKKNNKSNSDYFSTIEITQLPKLITIYQMLYKTYELSEILILTKILSICQTMNIGVSFLNHYEMISSLLYVINKFPKIYKLYQKELSSFAVFDYDKTTNEKITRFSEGYVPTFIRHKKQRIKRKKKWYGFSK